METPRDHGTSCCPVTSVQPGNVATWTMAGVRSALIAGRAQDAVQHEPLVVLADVDMGQTTGGAEPPDRAVEQLEQAVRRHPGVDRGIEVELDDSLLEDAARVAVHLDAHLHHDGAALVAE